MSTPSTPPSRPGSAATDSTGASRNSPRTPSTPAWPSKDLSLSKPATSQDNKLPSGDRLGEGQCDSPRDEGVMVIFLQQLVHLNPRHQARQLAQSLGLLLVHKLSRQPNLRFQSLHGSSSAKRPFEDITPEDTRTQYPHLHPPPGAQAPLPTFPPNPAPGCPHPPLVHPQTSYSPNMQAGRPFPSPGPPSESASPWSETLRRHGMGGSLFGVEGQQALLALPGNQEPIPVHVDFSQASKKADEKRHRNAEASTRHRRKKKIMQEEKAKQLQELRDERRLMEIRIEELIQQGDFYREDRNRLRDIVAQTASISSLAAGPPSPTISISNSYAETGSLASGPSGSMSYGDILSNERPAQRRRTDDRPEYSVPPYGSPASGHPSASPSGLPPMPMAGYGGPSRPSCAASSASGERLPPLRVMEGLPPTGLPPGQAFKSRIREPVSGFPFSLEFQRLDGQQGTLIVGLDVMEFV
uniref:BZIP domain-containing protein n=1 Tax=Fusarium oxysporum (strain Fo5176) TaxID=660025 RepID=A0A0D2YCV5_FUSOF